MKHAYLILAHTDINLLKALISCLDDERNDIYIHWDAKSGKTPALSVQHACLTLLKQRIDVRWAGFSMVEAEYSLLREAYNNGPYSYYHLLSGVDLPVKTQDYIHSECESAAGKEFIAFADTPQSVIDYRVQHYFLFSNLFKSKNIFIRGLRYLYLMCQDILKKKRTDLQVWKGAQWFSITHQFVAYLLEKEEFVRTTFNHTFCPDEMFVQTVCMNSPFRDRIMKDVSEYDGNKRFIKWKNGNLLPITEDDFSAIISSDKWFARKFSSSDVELINKVVQLVK